MNLDGAPWRNTRGCLREHFSKRTNFGKQTLDLDAVYYCKELFGKGMAMKTGNRRSNKSERFTFKQLLGSCREKNTKTAWERACTASSLRHVASRNGLGRTAKILSGIKERALRRAAAILPDEIHIGIDSDYQIGLVSVTWRNHGRLHLPAQAVMNGL